MPFQPRRRDSFYSDDYSSIGGYDEENLKDFYYDKSIWTRFKQRVQLNRNQYHYSDRAMEQLNSSLQDLQRDLGMSNTKLKALLKEKGLCLKNRKEYGS